VVAEIDGGSHTFHEIYVATPEMLREITNAEMSQAVAESQGIDPLQENQELGKYIRRPPQL
jgi:hypothetical protein